MKKVRFTGYSDDIIIVSVQRSDSIPDEEEFYVRLFGIKSESTDECMKVRAKYDNTGVWHFSPFMWNEDTEFPDWGITIAKSLRPPYSMELTMNEVPDDAYIIPLEGAFKIITL